MASSNQTSVRRARLGEFSPEPSPSRLHMSLLFDVSSCAASFHCNPSISSIFRNTGSSVCSAAREHAAAWSSQTWARVRTPAKIRRTGYVSIIKCWTGFLTLHASGHSVAGANAAGASSSPQLFSPEREGRIGNKEIALAVMPITEIAGDVRIDAARRPGMARRL